MKENKNNQSVYKEPEIQVIHMTETDIITTNGGRDDEGEIIPFNN